MTNLIMPASPFWIAIEPNGMTDHIATHAAYAIKSLKLFVIR